MQEMTAPTIPFNVMGVPKSQWLGQIMMIGVSAISVEAMPAAVNWTAISERPTPTKGPQMTARMT